MTWYETIFYACLYAWVGLGFGFWLRRVWDYNKEEEKNHEN